MTDDTTNGAESDPPIAPVTKRKRRTMTDLEKYQRFHDRQLDKLEARIKEQNERIADLNNSNANLKKLLAEAVPDTVTFKTPGAQSVAIDDELIRLRRLIAILENVVDVERLRLIAMLLARYDTTVD